MPNQSSALDDPFEAPRGGQGGRPAFTLIELLIVVGIVGLLVGLAVPALHKARMAARRIQCGGQLRQVGIALCLCHDARGAFPPGMSYRAEGGRFRLAGWQVWLLPYVEQGVLYGLSLDAFRQELDVRRNPPHVGLATSVAVYACPLDERVGGAANVIGVEVAFTSYLGNEGTDQYAKDGVLFVDSRVRFADIADGASGTLLAGERPPSKDLTLGWWYAAVGLDRNGAADMVGGAREVNRQRGRRRIADCPDGPFEFGPGDLQNPCHLFHFWSLHPGGSHFLFADGAVRFLGYSGKSILPALATRAGGEPVSLPD